MCVGVYARARARVCGTRVNWLSGWQKRAETIHWPVLIGGGDVAAAEASALAAAVVDSESAHLAAVAVSASLVVGLVSACAVLEEGAAGAALEERFWKNICIVCPGSVSAVCAERRGGQYQGAAKNSASHTHTHTHARRARRMAARHRRAATGHYWQRRGTGQPRGRASAPFLAILPVGLLPRTVGGAGSRAGAGEGSASARGVSGRVRLSVVSPCAALMLEGHVLLSANGALGLTELELRLPSCPPFALLDSALAWGFLRCTSFACSWLRDSCSRSASLAPSPSPAPTAASDRDDVNDFPACTSSANRIAVPRSAAPTTGIIGRPAVSDAVGGEGAEYAFPACTNSANRAASARPATWCRPAPRSLHAGLVATWSPRAIPAWKARSRPLHGMPRLSSPASKGSCFSRLSP